MLTEKQGEAYKQDGYLKVERVFTPKAVEELHFESSVDYRSDVRNLV